MSTLYGQIGRLVGHSSIYAVGNVVRQLAGFIMLPIYTRHLSPAEYGVVALLAFALALSEPLFGARMGQAMPKFYYDETASRSGREGAVISTAFIVTGFVSALSSFLVFYFREPISDVLFGSQTFALAVGIFGTQLVTQAIEYYCLTYIRIQQRPYLYVSITTAKLALQIALNVYLVVYLDLGVMGVVLGGVASSSALALLLTIYVAAHTGVSFDRTIAIRMLSFCWPLWFAGLLSLYVFQSNRYLIRVFGSLDEVGIFEIAAKFALVLPLIVWQPFSQYWETESYRVYHGGKDQSAFRAAFTMLLIGLITAGLAVSIFVQPTIRIMSSAPFHAAASLVAPLVLANLLVCLGMFCNFSFLVSEKTALITKFNFWTAAVVTVGNLALIPPFGALGAALAQVLAASFQFAVIQRSARACFDMGLKYGDGFRLLLIASIAYLVAEYGTTSLEFWPAVAVRGLVFVVFLGIVTRSLLQEPTIRGAARSLLQRLRSRST